MNWVDFVRSVTLFWVFGLFLWTLVEYGMHRFLFHIDEWLPDNRWFLTAHFLLHGVHHYLPTDRLRLVMPPTLFLALAYPWYRLTRLIFPYYVAIAVYSGGIMGYIIYDTTHYLLHHQSLPSYWRGLKKYHLAHHYKNFDLGYGVTSKLWDIVFGNQIPSPSVHVPHQTLPSQNTLSVAGTDGIGTQLDLGPKLKSVE
jgi:4-hydroxysphinganine ceramide fatty acyl 2-hydroxylase